MRNQFMSLLTLREHDTFAIGDAFCADGRKSVTHEQADALDKLSKRLASAKGGLFTHANRTTLKARQYVGVVQLGAEAIEVIPKIDGLNEQGARIHLFRMLARTRRLEIHEADIARLAAQDLNILEIFIRLFCDKLFTEVHRGLVSRYERHADNLPTLRGKLLTGLQATLNAFQPERFQCEFDEFTVDTPLNRVLKTTVRFLRRVTRHSDNARRLAELDFTLDGVSDVDATALEWHRLHFDRAALTLAGWQVALQGPSHALLQDADTGAGVFQTKPDITGLRDGKPVWIIDTKWKRLDEDKRNQRISQADVYQMLGYAHRYDVRDVFLLYPHQVGIDGEAGLQRRFRILDGGAAHGEQFIHVASIDLRDLRTVPAQLRSLLEAAGVTPAKPVELAA